MRLARGLLIENLAQHVASSILDLLCYRSEAFEIHGLFLLGKA
jgi:hypothetical protein